MASAVETAMSADQTGARLLQAQRARKTAQEDALKLQNRVQQLKKEEDKAHKRIQETKKRASEIRSLRDRNESHRLQKEALASQRNKELALQMEQLMQQKKDSEFRKQTTAENLAKYKMNMREATKDEQAAHERMLAEQRLMERKKALESKETVKQKALESKEKALIMKQQQMDASRADYQRRLGEEMKEQQRQERELQKLAAQELELIDRLQKKQHEQRVAYEELESALGLKAAQSSTVQAPAQAQPVQPPPADLDEPDEAEVARQFGMLDEEGTGYVSTSQLNTLMCNLGIQLNEAQLETATFQLDKDSTGKISYGEFLLWWSG